MTSPPSPALDDEAIAAHVDAALRLAGITMAPNGAKRARNFKTVTAAAQFVMAFPLDDEGAWPGLRAHEYPGRMGREHSRRSGRRVAWPRAASRHRRPSTRR